ncbi:MAG: heavy metal-associated domain-containing protein [Dermatophilaceae bacterium]
MSETTTIIVTGMTCQHCSSSVTEELSAIPGVREVSVDLHAGEDSPVTISSDTPLDPAAVSAAVAEAGYSLR